MQTTIDVPLADQVLELISEFRAARDAGRQASPVPVSPVLPVAPPAWQSVLLAIGLLAAGSIATDVFYPLMSRHTPFARPTFALFASVAVAGRLGGARAAWLAVLFTLPVAEVLLGGVPLEDWGIYTLHAAATLMCAAVVAASFTPVSWLPNSIRRRIVRRSVAARSAFWSRFLQLRFCRPRQQPAAG
jgi:hypothetical protein